MKKETIVAVAGFALAGAVCADVAAMPAIPEQSVRLSQNSLNRLVTISYTLENAPAIVTADVLTNGVSIGDEHLTAVYGDINKAMKEYKVPQKIGEEVISVISDWIHKQTATAGSAADVQR